MKWNRTCVVLAWVLLLAVLPLGCAGVKVDQQAESEAALRERAEAYWKLRVDQKLTELYEYESPDYRKKLDLQNYILVWGNSAVTNAEIQSVSVDGDSGMVILRTTEYFPLMGSKGSPREDYWRRIEGQWYHLRIEPKFEKTPSTGKRKKQEAGSP